MHRLFPRSVSGRRRAKLLEAEWRGCSDCVLCHTRANVVQWRGHLPSPVTLIGEAPGKTENRWGLPFVGEAGHLLNALLSEAKVRTYAVMNVLGCIPVKTESDSIGTGEVRPPRKQEVMACRPRLEGLLELAEPQVVFTLGQVAKNFLPRIEVPVVSLRHPAAILRDPPAKQAMEERRFVLTIQKHLEELDV